MRGRDRFGLPIPNSTHRVIPANAGIQLPEPKEMLDSGLRPNDALRDLLPIMIHYSRDTVLASPTMPVTAVLYWAMASSGDMSPETTFSVMRWISAETLL